MRIIVDNEKPFQILGSTFSISAPSTDVTLQYSVDGINYQTLKTYSAGEIITVSGRASGTFYKLIGNTGSVEVTYGKVCTETAGVGSINGETGEISLKTINGNSIIGEGNIDIEDDSAIELNPVDNLPESAETGTVVATSDGLYQYKDNEWKKFEGVDSINGETGEISLKTINGNSIIGEGDIIIEDDSAIELNPVDNLPESAETGTVVATTDGLYQYKDNEWKKFEGGEGKPSFYLTANEDATAIVEDENLEALKAHFISGGSSRDINVFLVFPEGDETMIGTDIFFIDNDESYVIGVEFTYATGGYSFAYTWSADEVIENTLQISEVTQITDGNNVLLADRTFSHSDPEDASQSYNGTVPVAIDGFFDRFVQITQEEYDALGDDVNDNTIYIIKD